jgi:hypothetical protein
MDTALFMEEILEVYGEEARRSVVAAWVDRLVADADVRGAVVAQAREELEALAHSVAKARDPREWVPMVAAELEELELVIRSEAALPGAIGAARVTRGDETWVIFSDESVMLPDGGACSHYAVAGLDRLAGVTVEAIGRPGQLAEWIARRLGVSLTPGSVVI